MKIDHTKVGNGLIFLEQWKLIKVVDKVSNCLMTFLYSSWIMLQPPHQEHHIGNKIISEIIILDVPSTCYG
jgi:hypothetical protein